MAWFADIAGKAEDLLNKVDQTAATALQSKNRNPNLVVFDHFAAERNSETYGKSVSSSASSSLETAKDLKYSRIDNKKAAFTPKASNPVKKPESDDEKLLRFLNNPQALIPEQKNPRKSATNMSQSNGSVSTVSEDSEVVNENKNYENVFESKSLSELNEASTKSKDAISEKSGIDGDFTALKDNCSFKNPSFSSTGALDSGDIKQVEKRAQHAEAEMKRMTMKLEHWNSQISSNDKLVRELKEREKDMVAAVDAKDSQLAILKVRLQEADQELQIKKSLLQELTTENERMIQKHAESASFQNKTVEVLQNQLQQAETELMKTKESLNQVQLDHMNQRTKMEEEHRHLVDSYTSLQKKWNDVSERNRDLLSQLKAANANFETLQQEYNDYKVKAQRILQTKEKLISNLKEGNFENDSADKFEASSALLNAEVESIKQERDLLKEELRRSNELIENFRYEVHDLEKTSQNDLASSHERCRILKEQLEMEKVQREECHLLNVQLKEELELLKDDLATTKNSFQSRIQDREIEIEKLRRQLTAKSLSTVSQDELESRLHALTENLIQKQTMVEALSTEKNSLVLQLERLEQQLREAQNYGAQQHTYVGINNKDLTDRKPKSVFLENPFDSNLTRRVKKVYGSIDALSIRLGVFFRRYPIARVFVFIYMLLLHFWVMIVLLTYEPEIHHAGYDHGKVVTS